MRKNRRANYRPLPRFHSTVEARPRILVLCEGKATEPGYIKALCEELQPSRVHVVIEGHGEDPKALVERAVVRKRGARRSGDLEGSQDQIWCVFDVDDHARLADALQQARANGIELAVSNPCFELWALLHFQDQTAFVDREKVRAFLKKHLPDYRKALPFDQMWLGYEEAVRRAEHLDRRCEERGCPGDNPSTGVYRLTELIRKEGTQAEPSIRGKRGFLRGIDTTLDRDPDRL
jgi:hypothetical protein